MGEDTLEQNPPITEMLHSIAVSIVMQSRSAAVPFVAGRVRELLRPFFPVEQELQWFELALREALQNAYEHGNLGISGEDKRRLCEQEAFEGHLRECEAKATAEGRTLTLRIELSGNQLRCIVSDQGGGFDWKSLQSSLDSTGPADPNGRGLFLIEKVFDKIAFNEAGNELQLTKNLVVPK